jgi:hypothetical protein
MTDIQRWDMTGSYWGSVMRVESKHGPYVTYADHVEALRQAVASVTSFAIKQIMGEEEDTRRDLLAAYEQGQRDALAAAVQRVEALRHSVPSTDRVWMPTDEVIAAIKGEQA